MAIQKRTSRSPEHEAVRTTIVGARPPGSGKGLGNIPRGIEVLVKKASVDAEFEKVLVEKRAEAAGEIGLSLDPAETMMVNNVPTAQLEAIIANTKVSPKSRAAFLGRAAAVMLAAVGAGIMGCGDDDGEYKPSPAGTCADRPKDRKLAVVAQVEKEAEPPTSEIATQDSGP